MIKDMGFLWHSLIAMALVSVALASPWGMALLNMAFWLGREIGQKPDDMRRVVTRLQPFLEWAAPSLAGFVLAGVLP